MKTSANTLYPQVNINGAKYVHRLVALAFIPNPDNKKEVNHKNGNKHDSRVVNLEWNTPKENINHAFDNKQNHSGSKHFRAKLTEVEVFEIHRLYKETNMSQREVAEIFGISAGHVGDIVSGQRWKRLGK